MSATAQVEGDPIWVPEEGNARATTPPMRPADAGHGTDGGIGTGRDAIASKVMASWNAWLASKAPKTVRLYRFYVGLWMDALPKAPWLLGPLELQAGTQTFINDFPPPTQRTALASVRSFLKHMHRTVTCSMRPMPATEPEEPISPEEINMLLGACENAQDRALLLTLWSTGARISALLSVTVRDEVWEKGALRFRAEFSKTRREAYGPLSESALAALREIAEGKEPCDHLFPGPTGKALPYSCFWERLQKIVRVAGIRRRIHAHLFRKTRAVAFARAGAREEVVINALGWKNGRMYHEVYAREPGLATIEEARAYVDDAAVVRIVESDKIGRLERRLAEQGKLLQKLLRQRQS